MAEARFDGMVPHTLSGSVPASLLIDGENTLMVENAADPSAYSFVYLDRFSLDYPRALVPEAGVLEGRAPEAGTVFVPGFAPGSALLDLSGDQVRWLRPSIWGSDTLSFFAKGGHGASPHTPIDPIVIGASIVVVRPSADHDHERNDQAQVGRKRREAD